MKITICACSSRTFIGKEKVATLAAMARKSGMEVNIVSDLCELCEQKDECVHEIAATTVVACHPRAVKSLLEYVGEENTKSLNLRTDSVEEVSKTLGIDAAEVDEAEINEVMQTLDSYPQKLGEDAWYPTLDKDVCCECGKCHEFCPFGVYEIVEDRIRVMHPTHCKNNCPACARMCPASAIIFPKYDRSPINGGIEQQEQAVQLDTKELYADALRQKLADRKMRISMLKK